MLHRSIIVMKSVAEESTRNLRRGEGKGEKDITRPRLNLILTQIARWNQNQNRNLIPILIRIHHLRLT